MSSAIPDDVYRFLVQCIDSVEQLEILLLLHKSLATEWSAEQVARTLYSNTQSVARRLAGLHAKELLVRSDSSSTYRYQPAKPETDATVSLLAELYRERRVAVITIIATEPMEHVRAFSDAFRLRKKEKE